MAAYVCRDKAPVDVGTLFARYTGQGRRYGWIATQCLFDDGIQEGQRALSAYCAKRDILARLEFIAHFRLRAL